jgi:hypothetical protein
MQYIATSVSHQIRAELPYQMRYCRFQGRTLCGCGRGVPLSICAVCGLFIVPSPVYRLFHRLPRTETRETARGSRYFSAISNIRKLELCNLCYRKLIRSRRTAPHPKPHAPWSWSWSWSLPSTMGHACCICWQGPPHAPKNPYPHPYPYPYP